MFISASCPSTFRHTRRLSIKELIAEDHEEEYEEAYQIMMKYGLENGWVQEHE